MTASHPSSPPTPAPLCGLLVVDKPLGWSSFAVVRRVRRAAAGAKVGHAGTLDPLATGIVICCIGKATRQVDRLMGLTKVYEAEVDLSAFTTTDDREGPPTPVPIATAPDETALRAALAQFVGIVQQRPPAFSAMKVQGRRAYKLARKGAEVQLEPRPVRIDAIDLLAYAFPMTRLRITCGKGTYIRSLARDLGTALRTGGHLAGLRRLAVGPYDLSRAVPASRLDHPLTQADLLPVEA